MIPLPPRGQLAGFRDPYIFARGGGGRPWKMLLGSGVPGRGGTLLVYHAPTLTSGASAAVDSLTILQVVVLTCCCLTQYLPLSQNCVFAWVFEAGTQTCSPRWVC